jgi:hypothetical protein
MVKMRYKKREKQRIQKYGGKKDPTTTKKK